MQTDGTRTARPAEADDLDLRNGELVEVLSEQEILATLDERGRLEALPFMPEMLRYAGRRFRVGKVASKVCDQVKHSGNYRMERTVHLEGLRCDGQAHGGCQAGCLLYWKHAWLKRVEPGAPSSNGQAPAPAPVAEALAAEAPGGGPPPCTLAALRQATRAEPFEDGQERFSCQATELPRAWTTHIRAWDPRPYVRDVLSGNAGLWQTVRGVLALLFNKYQKASRRLPRPLRIHGGANYPFVDGAHDRKTPKQLLDLQPGELVEVKSRQEIFQTLDQGGHNRGLRFDVEGLRYCGQRARVLRRVNRLIDEKTGRMINIPGDCIVLDGVVCAADWHQNCPRGIYEFWREIWLRRVE
jgi:hypothetical protein